MTQSLVKLDRQGATAILTVSNPPVNALHPDVSEAISTAAAEIDADTSIRSLVLTGEGRSFIAGGDLQYFMTLDRESAAAMATCAQSMQQRLARLRVPVLGAINGYALGGGLEVAAACDILLADERAVFGLPEVTLGVIPGAGGTQMLVDLLPRGRARRLLFTGDRFTAAEAEAWGLVDQVVPAGTVVDAALEVAVRINAAAPLAVEAAKESARQAIPQSLDAAHRNEIALFAQLFDSHDTREGILAFLEGRKARFDRK